MTDDRTFVIVGGGLAGAKAAEALRERGFEGPVVLLGAEAHRPYERPPLSKGYLKTGERLDDGLRPHADWYAEHDVELRTGTTVAAIDRDARRGRHSPTASAIGYDRLLLATGIAAAAPRRARRRPGRRAATLRTIEDSDRIRRSLQPGARLVVSSARGWIGLEVAAAAREAGADGHRARGAGAAAAARARARDRPGVRRPAPRARRRPAHSASPVEAIAATDGAVERGACWPTARRCPPTRWSSASAPPRTSGSPRRPVWRSTTASWSTRTLRTSDPDIYAAGDVANVDHPLLGRAHAGRALGQRPQPARRSRPRRCSTRTAA